MPQMHIIPIEISQNLTVLKKQILIREGVYLKDMANLPREGQKVS